MAVYWRRSQDTELEKISRAVAMPPRGCEPSQRLVWTRLSDDRAYDENLLPNEGGPPHDENKGAEVDIKCHNGGDKKKSIDFHDTAVACVCLMYTAAAAGFSPSVSPPAAQADDASSWIVCAPFIMSSARGCRRS